MTSTHHTLYNVNYARSCYSKSEQQERSLSAKVRVRCGQRAVIECKVDKMQFFFLALRT